MLCAITDLRSLAEDESAQIGTLLEMAKQWANEGVEFVQLREKHMPAGAMVALARAMVTALGGRTKLLVNGRADVALAAGAAGVHLTSHPDELTPAQVRLVFAGARVPVVSISCHTVAEAQRAQESGADLILFGPIFEKRVGAEVVVRGVGLEALREAARVAGALPVLALGGVTRENAAECVRAGAAGVAGIRVFQAAKSWTE